jgi:hypothetical protein
LRYLERYVRCYTSNSGGSAAGPQVICTHADVPAFQPLTSRQRQDIRDAVNVLTLTSIIPNMVMGVCTDNDSVAPPNSERYQLFFQSFDPADKHIAVQSGSVLHAGVKIATARFPMPWSTGGELLGPRDGDVLKAFGKLLAQKRRRAETRRLFQSLDWFRFAHVGAEDTSIFSKAIMMGTAFEILLDIGGIQQKRDALTAAIDQLLDEGSHKKETRQIVSRSGKTITPITHTKAGWWMWAFYQARNAIAHGDAVDGRVLRYGNRRISWLSHLIVADLVFWECVLWQLFERKLVGNGARRLAASWSKLWGQRLRRRVHQTRGTVEPRL